MPKVSMGMPVYNGENFIAAALDSLLAQTYEDFELIISDNCSEDGTEDICRAYSERDKRIIYIRQDENLGAIHNFNTVAKQACGEFFKFAASDDICSPSFLKECVQVLNQCPETLWCHSQSCKIDQYGNLVQKANHSDNASTAQSLNQGLPRLYSRSPHPHERFKGVLLGTTWCADIYGLFRRETLCKTQLLLPYFGAEKVLVGELSLLGLYREVPQVLFYQRIHSKAGGSLKSSNGQQHYMDPKSRQRNSLIRLQLLQGHLESILRSHLKTTERAKCFWVILQYLFQVRKWKKVALSMATGSGLGS